MADTPSPIVRVMTTPLAADGLPQPHPPDYHAEITAEKIIVVAETATQEIQRAGRELRKKVEAILLAHHNNVHEDEQAQLKQHGIARLDHKFETGRHVDEDLLAEIVDAARGTILQEHFTRKDVQDVILAELHHETRSQMYTHRLVHGHRDVMSKKTKLVP